MKVFPRTALCSILLFFLFNSCEHSKHGRHDEHAAIEGDIIIFHAGSLSVPFRQIAGDFEKEFPGTRVLLEAAGSVASARKITDLKKPCDIMASADYRIIENLLIPGFTGWHIPYAANEMIIAYNHDLAADHKITSDNWPELLSRPDLRIGRSDPDSDPCGYRTLMTFQLAEEYYNIPGLTETLSGKDRKYIRPKEVDLLALLELREIDYIFIYKSVAIQHGLKYVELPEEINLGNPVLDEHYQKAVVKITGKEPGKTMEIKGEAMIYSVTILHEAPNPKAAVAFLSFLLEKDKGLKIMEESGQKPIVPLKNRFYDHLPYSLRKFANKFNDTL